MALDLEIFRASTYLLFPGDQASTDERNAWELQPTLASLRDRGALREPLSVLVPEGWILDGTAPVVGWVAPPWDDRVERIDEACVRVPARLLRTRLDEALALAMRLGDDEHRLDAIESLHTVVSLAEETERTGDALVLRVSA